MKFAFIATHRGIWPAGMVEKWPVQGSIEDLADRLTRHPNTGL